MYDFWDDAAKQNVEDMFSLVRPKAKPRLSRIRNELDEFIQSLYSAPAGFLRATVYWSNIGATAVEMSRSKPGLLPLTVVEVADTLVRKQRDYGPENIRRFGRAGLMVRMHDKVARLENLEQSGRSPENESVRDTFLDIVGYSAIGMMWENNEFLLPLRDRP
jgi:hypothetical protein